MFNGLKGKKYIVVFMSFLFLFYISSEALIRAGGMQQSEVEKLISEGDEFHRNGEYEKAIIKYFEAKDIAQSD